ncbi:MULTISPECIES: carboxynorspermidine decarboxylase [unclassified Neorhizobium]|uniref:carboxynorspermidine decarboxylase n=1 Tax=unclassified Neorhizobium TaxID=2629175 RepID=UPI001FF12255|nr:MULTISPECIES: carboxynorspermidine decarboxylase [unclassified Neorhizobium]MCJ9669418.1 carboxynorspermidine decarboxylase [Neorhizobium sp. SHOUNA12B]MCJ9745557.1 carboxynorspermidine decarboxylase [Neorhizobium sp. SHOUNA12A]
MIDTPYYLIDKARLLSNMEAIAYVRQRSGAKVLLALKCFATWSVFDLMREYMDGTTSSSLYETRLGRDRFCKETHAYSVAYSDSEIEEVISYSDKIIFNSVSQLNRFAEKASRIECGLRINPRISSSNFDLADPARPFSRLGEWDVNRIGAVMGQISGFMIHNNCSNGDFDLFDRTLGEIEVRFGALLRQVKWVSLGGGILFTREGYPIEAFAGRLKAFSEKYGIQVYLEPGEASIKRSATLETTVLDIFHNGKNLVVVDSSIEAHMLDLLVYRERAQLAPDTGDHSYMVCGNSCLAGDIFGEFRFPHPLKIGDRISFQDAAHYTIVKKNWFNGVRMPTIAIRELDGSIRKVREFTYTDYEQSLS